MCGVTSSQSVSWRRRAAGGRRQAPGPAAAARPCCAARPTLLAARPPHSRKLYQLWRGGTPSGWDEPNFGPHRCGAHPGKQSTPLAAAAGGGRPCAARRRRRDLALGPLLRHGPAARHDRPCRQHAATHSLALFQLSSKDPVGQAEFRPPQVRRSPRQTPHPACGGGRRRAALQRAGLGPWGPAAARPCCATDGCCRTVLCSSK